jgi:hypothetical protein
MVVVRCDASRRVRPVLDEAKSWAPQIAVVGG